MNGWSKAIVFATTLLVCLFETGSLVVQAGLALKLPSSCLYLPSIWVTGRLCAAMSDTKLFIPYANACFSSRRYNSFNPPSGWEELPFNKNNKTF